MGIINRKQAAFIGLLTGIGFLLWLIKRDPKHIGTMKFISIRPSKAYKNRETDSLRFREDYFAIMNLDRSDSVALLRAVAQHACQVTDSVDLRKYSLYRIEYYEHGIYMNDSTINDSPFNHNTLHRQGAALWHVADEIDAFVYWIIYDEGELSMIKWYKTGELDRQKQITVNQEVKQLFNRCKNRK